jgi:hypothetical protein
MFNILANDSRSVIAAEYLFALYQRDASRKPISSISESHDMPCKLKCFMGGSKFSKFPPNFHLKAQISLKNPHFNPNA